ncbi:MAG TPA: hypothetical protein VI977_01630 [archaeon]|nr:hypothetical protein [archaeon]
MALKKFSLDAKGQAAITDALYLLLIVSGLSVLLFSFSMKYGGTVSQQMENEFGIEYSSSAFKTIFYSSTPRIAGQSLDSESTIEIDYLLAAAKEDFADNCMLDNTREVLANNIVGIMEPLQDNFDYAFLIFNNGNNEKVIGCNGHSNPVVFLLFFLHDKAFPASASSGETSIWLCSPPMNSDASKTMESLLSKVGSVPRASSQMQLPVLQQPLNTIVPQTAEATLAMWVSKGMPETEFNALNCQRYWQTVDGKWQPCLQTVNDAPQSTGKCTA